MISTKTHPNSILSECYRNLRTSLEYSHLDKDIKTLVVTSSEQGEGKSTVALNLGYILAQGGKKVIIIDCDLRKPSIHKKLKISNLKGLTDYLIRTVEISEITHKIDESLDVITAGTIPPNPADVVNSKSVQDFFDLLKENYDYIIIDTPPVIAVTDGQILAGESDGTLFVVRADKTTKDSVIKGYKELKKVNANLLGAVINSVSKNEKNYYYYDNSKKKKKRNM